MEKDYIVKKSNYFIMNSSYDLSLEEQKIILALASMVQPEDTEFKSYKFKIADFMELLGVDTKTKYTEIPKITRELMKKVFEIQEGNTLIQTAWLSGAKYEKGTGYVELTFSSYLKPYMLQLKERFTQYQLANVLTMKSKYSPRIYEILKCNQFKQQGYIELELDVLRKLLKAENIYPKYNDFKRYIILKTQKELKEKTDIKFEFEEIKTGRKVTGIRFYIVKNKTVSKEHKLVEQTKQEIAITEATVTSEYNEASGEEISEYDTFEFAKNIFKDKEITGLDAKKVYDAAVKTIKKKNLNISVGEFLIKKKIIVDDYSKTHTLERGYMATLMAAIKKDWDKPKKVYTSLKDPKDPFCDYEQRSYDFEELERKLLGWDKDETEKENEEETAVNFTKLTNEKRQDFAEEQLRKLSELRDLGILTSDEYELKKEMLLNGSYKPI